MFYKPNNNFLPEETVVYLRKSRSDDPLMDVEEVLANHEKLLDDWAENNLGGIIPEENKYREVVSGETLKDRPEILKLLHKIESPKIKAVAVVEPQRLTRGDLEDIGRMMKLLKHTHTLVATPQRIYDLTDDYDFDAFERELKRGNDYLEYTKKILNRGRLLSVSQGYFIGSIPPYGYEKTFVMDGKRKRPTLAEKSEEADTVRMIFDLYVNKDYGTTNICNILEELHIKPPKGKYWSPYAVNDMLSNIHYIGKVKWNWRKTVLIVEDSEIIKTRPKAKDGDCLVYDGKHPAIVSEELFQAAQEKRGRTSRQKASTELRNPFAGLLFCRCGRAMSLRFYKDKLGKERSAPRLLCDGQTRCRIGSCRYSEIVDRVCNALEKHIHDFTVKLQSDEPEVISFHQEKIRLLERRLKELQEKELALWEMQSDPDVTLRMPPEIFRTLNEKTQAEKESVQQSLREAYETMPSPVDYAKKISTYQEALDSLRNDTITAKEKNRLLKFCIDRMEYYREPPERMKSSHSDKILVLGANWSDTPIKLDVKMKV